jgi:hypothetical protein
MKLLKFVLLKEFRKDVQKRCVIYDKTMEVSEELGGDAL